MTTIDILLPFYGDFSYLREAVFSVLRQTDPNWRLIVVDDADPNPEIASWFGRLGHASVSYHRNDTNLGANGNYRRALNLATSEYVVVMGADDVMLANYVAAVRRAARLQPGVAVIQPGVKVIDGTGRYVLPLADRIKTLSTPRCHGKGHKLVAGEALASSLLNGNWTYFPSLCWRRNTITSIGFRPEFNVVQDLALLLDVAGAGNSLLRLRETAFLYRRHGASDSAVRTASGSRFEEERRLFESIRQESIMRGWPNAARAARLHWASRLHAATRIPSCLARGRWTLACELGKHMLVP